MGNLLCRRNYILVYETNLYQLYKVHVLCNSLTSIKTGAEVVQGVKDYDTNMESLG